MLPRDLGNKSVLPMSTLAILQQARIDLGDVSISEDLSYYVDLSGRRRDPQTYTGTWIICALLMSREMK